MNFVLVKNAGASFSSKYNGQLFEFKTGAEVPLTVEAARHIFGFGLRNKDEVLARHGWMHNSVDREKAMKRLGEFQFQMAKPQIVPDTPQLEIIEQTSPHIPPEETVVNGQQRAEISPSAPVAGGGEKGPGGPGEELTATTQTQEGGEHVEASQSTTGKQEPGPSMLEEIPGS